MVRPEGNLPELLRFRRLLEGPWNPEGEGCLERLRGVRELGVLVAAF